MWPLLNFFFHSSLFLFYIVFYEYEWHSWKLKQHQRKCFSLDDTIHATWLIPKTLLNRVYVCIVHVIENPKPFSQCNFCQRKYQMIKTCKITFDIDLPGFFHAFFFVCRSWNLPRSEELNGITLSINCGLCSI